MSEELKFYKEKCQFFDENLLELKKMQANVVNEADSDSASLRTPSTCPSDLLQFINTGKYDYRELLEENSFLKEEVKAMKMEFQGKIAVELSDFEKIQESQKKNEDLMAKLKMFNENHQSVCEENEKLRKQVQTVEVENQKLLLDLSHHCEDLKKLSKKSELDEEKIKFFQEQIEGLKCECDEKEIAMEKQAQEMQNGKDSLYESVNRTIAKIKGFKTILKEKDDKISRLMREISELKSRDDKSDVLTIPRSQSEIEIHNFRQKFNFKN